MGLTLNRGLPLTACILIDIVRRDVGLSIDVDIAGLSIEMAAWGGHTGNELDEEGRGSAGMCHEESEWFAVGV